LIVPVTALRVVSKMLRTPSSRLAMYAKRPLGAISM